jgi:malonyl-CoA O-methyltransferase
MGFLNSLKQKLVSTKPSGGIIPAEKAINWFKTYRIPGSGIPPQHNATIPTPEVTGYSIPTLYNWGEKELACDLARWEASIQRSDGGFAAPGTDVPYTFDTAQVVRGFLAVVDDIPELEGNLRRACDYVERNIAPDGEVIHESYDAWKFPDGTMLSEYGNLYVLPPMLQAGQKLSEPRYIQAARRGMDHYRRKPDLVEFKPNMSMLSHYLGYMMEALVDLGEVELAKKGLKGASDIQKKNGAIPAYPGVNWVCSTGMAQLAIAWYKLRERKPADKAMSYLERLQNPSGGFYGSYGRGAKYFPREEISWATKFFLDAYMLKIKLDFNGDVTLYSESIEDTDGRAQELLSFFGNLTKKKILDVGCGKGRYLKFLMKRFPTANYYGIDISDEMLRSCPKGAETSIGNMLSIRYPDSFFDAVFSVEALEHAVNIEAAIKEMVRVLKPNGKIVIIDKNSSKLGALIIKSWEKWFDADKIDALLQKSGVESRHKQVSYDNYSQPDGLFIAWEGAKRADSSKNESQNQSLSQL